MDAENTLIMELEGGPVTIKLRPDLAPKHVERIKELAREGFYDGVVFHRLVPGFVIQGGDGEYGRSPNVDPNQVGTGGPPYVIQDEPITAPYKRGTVAMARTPAPNSVGSQFFIVLDDSVASALSSAQYGYQIVGQVTSGMEAVDAIAALPNSGEPSNAAIDPIPMTKVTVATP